DFVHFDHDVAVGEQQRRIGSDGARDGDEFEDARHLPAIQDLAELRRRHVRVRSDAKPFQTAGLDRGNEPLDRIHLPATVSRHRRFVLHKQFLDERCVVPELLLLQKDSSKLLIKQQKFLLEQQVLWCGAGFSSLPPDAGWKACVTPLSAEWAFRTAPRAPAASPPHAAPAPHAPDRAPAPRPCNTPPAPAGTPSPFSG